MSRAVDLLLSGKSVSESILNEKQDLHQAVIAEIEKLIAATIFDGDFVIDTDLDSDGETDYCLGVIKPKDKTGLRVLGDRASHNILMNLYFYLQKGLKRASLDENVDWELDGVQDDCEIKFTVRIDRT